MKLSRQIVAMTSCVLLTAFVAVSAVAAYAGFEILRHQAQTELQTIAEAKKTAFIQYHQRLLKDVAALANSVLMAEAALEFDVAWSSAGTGDHLALQSRYAADGFYLAGETDLPGDNQTLAGYQDVHSRYHQTFLEVQQSQDFKDLMLLNADGVVVYSTSKQADFGVDLAKSSWRDTDLSKAFRQLQTQGDGRGAVFYDYHRYRGAGNAVVSFVAAPIVVDDVFQGVLAYQIRPDAVNALMMPPAGFAETGEVIVVGDDFMVRNDTGFTKDAPLNRRMDNEAVRLALSGSSGFITTESSAGYYLAYATPVDISGSEYALVVSQPLKAYLLPFEELGVTAGFALAAILCVLIGVSMMGGRRLARPIEQIAAIQNRLAGGDMNIAVPEVTSPREAADLGETMYVFKKQARNLERYQADQQNDTKPQDTDNSVRQLAEQYEASLASAIEVIASAMPRLSKKSMDVGEGVTRLSEQAGSARDRARQVWGEVGSLATSAETANSAFNDVAAKLDDTSGLSNSAARQATDAAVKIVDLSSASKRLDKLSETISEIAGRTNIVSLNASLEAARAGAGGKGFLVLAAEIKSLAGQIQRVADETNRHNAEFLSDMEAASVAVRMISDTANHANDTVTSVEGVVALQAVASGDVARAARGTADKVQILVDDLNTVAEGAAATDAVSGELRSTADELAKIGADLVNEVSKLLHDIKDQAGSAKSEP